MASTAAGLLKPPARRLPVGAMKKPVGMKPQAARAALVKGLGC